MKQSEAAEQETLIAWVRMMSRNIPELKWLHASLNGVKLSPGQAAKCKRQGMVAGIPDLFWPFPSHGYHGLYIELKTRTGRTSKIQRECMRYLKSVGYKVVVAHGWYEARKVLEAYIVGK